MGTKTSDLAAVLGSAIAVTDYIPIVVGGVNKRITVEELFSGLALLGLTLADVPSYADQAAAATALSGTGQLFRFATTGALGITIT